MRKIINEHGAVIYYNENNQYHREDGPAVECVNGHKEWWKNGKLHREDGPAIKYVSGTKHYYYNGEYYPCIKSDEEWIRFIKLIIFQ